MKLAISMLSLAMVLAPAPRAFSQDAAKASVKITNGPVIESVFDDHAVIAWSTNTPLSTTLKYGTDQSKLDQEVQSTGRSPHRVTVKNLQPSTTYYFKVVSTSGPGAAMSLDTPVYSLTTVAKGAAPQRENKNVGVQGENPQ